MLKPNEYQYRAKTQSQETVADTVIDAVKLLVIDKEQNTTIIITREIKR